MHREVLTPTKCTPYEAVFETALLEASRMLESLIEPKLLSHNIQQIFQILLKLHLEFIIPPL
jgi:hypothetical protein